MEKYYEDYNYNLRLAQYWFRMIGKDKRAKGFHTHHLAIAHDINARFKKIR